MRLTDAQALSFDCYGTLIDWESGITAVLRPWADGHGIVLSDEELLTSFAATATRFELEAPTELYPRILARSLQALGEQLRTPVTDDEADALGASVPDWPAFPDSAEALQRLSERFALIILSNVDRTSFAGSNRRLGVEFTSILTAQDIGSYKPDPRNFAALDAEVARLGVPRGAHVHVAQSLFHDHVPAKAAGLPTVWIDRRHANPGNGATPPAPVDVAPDWTFPSMSALADAVDAG